MGVGHGDGSGILWVISAPSGTGKSTVARELMQRVPKLEFSVSYTTRTRRDGERDGAHYHFVDRSTFDAMVRDGAFLEWANVFGRFYGTAADDTRKALDEGRQLLLDIDVQGARQVRSSGIPCVSVMLLPPDFATLEARLQGRGSEDSGQLRQRLAQARREVAEYESFDYVLINDRLEQTVEQLVSIVGAEGCRPSRHARRVKRILATFPTEREATTE